MIHLTTNQIAYNSLLEAKLHNRNVEYETRRANKANLAESSRHNRETESLQRSTLLEQSRHNIQTEQNQRYATDVQKYASELNYAASKYSADQHYAATVYAANSSYAATTAAASISAAAHVQSTRINANAQLMSATINRQNVQDTNKTNTLIASAKNRVSEAQSIRARDQQEKSSVRENQTKVYTGFINLLGSVAGGAAKLVK